MKETNEKRLMKRETNESQMKREMKARQMKVFQKHQVLHSYPLHVTHFYSLIHCRAGAQAYCLKQSISFKRTCKHQKVRIQVPHRKQNYVANFSQVKVQAIIPPCILCFRHTCCDFLLCNRTVHYRIKTV